MSVCLHNEVTVEFCVERGPKVHDIFTVDCRVRCKECREIFAFKEEVFFRDEKTQCRLVVHAEQTKRIISIRN